MNWIERLEKEEWFDGLKENCGYENFTIDYVAGYAAFTNNVVVLQFLLDEGASLNLELLGYCFDYESQCCLIDAGLVYDPVNPVMKNFIRSRNSARLAAILTMRAMRRLGSIYRDPAQMVGRAIWAQRAYYLEESERALKK